MQLKTAGKLSICSLFLLASISRAEDVFNTPSPQAPSVTDFYGTPAAVHSPDYYNNLITTKNNQAYQALQDSTKAKQNDPTLKALQEKMLNDSGSNKPPSLMTDKAQTAQAVTPPPRVNQPQPNVIYQTPVTSPKNNNNTATNFSGGSGSSNLDIQY